MIGYPDEIPLNFLKFKIEKHLKMEGWIKVAVLLSIAFASIEGKCLSSNLNPNLNDDRGLKANEKKTYVWISAENYLSASSPKLPQ